MRSRPTEAEARLWSILRAKRLAGHKFKRQQPIERYIVDFVNFEHRMVIEVDGSQHCDSAADRIRDDWLKSQGYKVLRFWNSEVLNNTDGVAEAIWQELQASQPPLPKPLSRQGRGA